jgi:hypothetical protein
VSINDNKIELHGVECQQQSNAGAFEHPVTIMLKNMSSLKVVALAIVLGIGIGGIAGQNAPGPRPEGQERVRFNRDVRPVLSTCFRCHGADETSRRADLRLDIRDEALKARRNGTPIVPGKPGESLVVTRIFETNPARIMPPASIHKELTDAQKQTIRRWLEQGAEYEGHWAYERVERPAVPVLRSATIRTPIDAFIQSRLEQEGLKPGEQADRRTLIRRLTLDLTGLAPAPADVEAFLQDRTANAYEKVVDRLMASPRYAEKQAIYWLDAVRYADTAGFHGDNPYPTWPYRDYVLQAFRDNKPFDVFTREQLAGDLLPNATEEQKIASAYNRLNRVSGEGGLQEKEYLAKYGADRVRTVSSVWLGSTLGCAECHNHKFDPFLAKDFYAMKAFFADINESGLARDGAGRNGPEAWGAKLQLPTAEEQRQIQDLVTRIGLGRQRLTERSDALASQRQQWAKDILERYTRGELKWQFQHPVSATAEGATLTVHDDLTVRIGSLLRFKEKPMTALIVASGANRDTETYTLTLKPGPGTWRTLGIEIARDDTLPGGYVARGGLGVELSEIEAEFSAAASAGARKISFVIASDPTGISAIDGDATTSWSVGDFGVSSSNPFGAFQFAEPVTTTADSTLVIRLRQLSETRRSTLGRFRLALSAGPAFPDDPLPGGTVEDTTLDPAKEYLGLPERLTRALATGAQAQIQTFFEQSSPELATLAAEVARLTVARMRVEMGVKRVMVSEALPTPRETRILPRGNWMDDSGAIVEPAIPEFLGKLAAPGRANRLDLANWIVSRQNPLTARAYVNRVWRQFFGTGLSNTPGDLGSQGEWPSHPALLDWLASEFMQPEFSSAGTHAWDMKHLVRTIVLSHTYRQSSMTTPQLDERDPGNRLLARQSRLRLDAEIVRDVLLQASGLLVEKFGGPSARPYQPDGYLAALNYPRRSYSADRGDGLYRRGIYTFWQRTFLHPGLLAFDAPTREECVLERASSDTPLQALDLLNDPIYVEAARVFAEHTLKDGGATPAARLTWAFYRAVGRPPEAAELRTLSDLHAKSLARFKSDPKGASQFVQIGEKPAAPGADAVNLAAMATVTRVILNLHEVITRD